MTLKTCPRVSYHLAIRSSLAALLLALAIRPAVAAQVDAVWTGGVSNWNNAVNWAPPVIPNNGTGGNTYRVKIDNGGAGASVVGLDINAQIDTLTIDVGDSLAVGNGLALALLGGPITNNGTLSLNSAGGFCDLRIDSDITLAGTGTLAMSNNQFNRIFGNVATRRLTNASTIRGSGAVCSNLMALTNQGLIQADQTTPLTIDPSTTGAVNTGTLRATNAATLVLTGGDFANAGGALDAQTASVVSVTNAVITGGNLTTTGTGAISPNTGRFHDVTNDGSLAVPNGLLGILTGTMTNNGTISLNSVGGFSDLRIDSDVTLNGPGTVAMSDNQFNRIFGDITTRRLTNNSTIRGSGSVGANLMALTNNSLIQADQPTALTIDPSASGAINNGTLRATNAASLVLHPGDFNNAAGIIEAQNASAVVVTSGAVVTGGSLTTSGSGTIVPNSGRFQNVTNNGHLSVPNGQAGIIAGAMTNNSTISLNSAGGFTDLRIDSDVSLNGPGTVAMSNNQFNRIFANVTTDRLTNNSTIRGSGNVGANLMALTNNSLIQADQPTALTIDPSASGAINNSIFRATSAASLVLAPGEFDNSAGTIEAQNASAVVVTSGAVVTGGSLTTSGSGTIVPNSGRFQDVTNNGHLSVPNGQAGIIAGNMTNNATISLNSAGGFSDLFIDGSATLLGGGNLVMSNNSFNRILGATAASRLINSSTIRGAGQLGINRMALTNFGAIIADQPTTLTIDITDSESFPNYGQINVTGAGGLSIATGPFANSGTVTINAACTLSRTGQYSQPGGTTTVNGTLNAASGFNNQAGSIKGSGTINGPVTNAGTVGPGNSAGTLTVAGTYSQTSLGSMNIELGGLTPGTEYDRLAISGAASLNGWMNVSAINGFVPSLGQTFTVLTAGSVTGAVGPISVFNFPPGLTVSATYNPTSVVLTVVAGANTLGDLNCDNVVDTLDIPAFVTALRDPAAYLSLFSGCQIGRADMNGDGLVNGVDIQLFLDALL